MSQSNLHRISAGKQTIGIVEGGIFYKSVDGSRHFLRSPRGLAVDLDALDGAEPAGASSIQITDRETGNRYTGSSLTCDGCVRLQSRLW